MSDFYWTIDKTYSAEYSEKKSLFISHLFAIKNKEYFKEELDIIKKKYPKANHNCYAYRLGNKGLDYRSSDDGEPSGTAGKPILFMLKKYELSDVALVVTRIFGGILLGKGPLAKAYAKSSELALEKIEKIKVDITQKVQLFLSYDELSIVKKLLSDFAISSEENYTDLIDITADIPKSKVEQFCKEIDSNTFGRAGTKVL